MPQLSLLWPAGTPAAVWKIPAETIRDLELESVMAALCPHESYREVLVPIVYNLCLDPATIRYRQDVLADLQAQPKLAAVLKNLLPVLDELALFSYQQRTTESTTLHEVVARVGELELLNEAVDQLLQAFTTLTAPLQSSGLAALHTHVESLAGDTNFQQLVGNLPSLLAKLRTSASITIGVNLDHFMRPEEAVLLAVNDYRFSENTFLDRLLGKGMREGKGIASLHRPPLVSKGSGMITGGAPVNGPLQRLDPMLVPLFKDLSEILEKVTKPIAYELRKYMQLNGRFLVDLRPDIIFYVHALTLIEKLSQAGMTWCWPEIAPAAARLCQVQDAYNLQLAIQGLQRDNRRPLPQRVVTNDINMDENGRIAILTGPNQGGKTTYMQAIGLVQALSQLGLPVPGTSGRISPVDAIYTHYPSEERLELGTGRFGDEAQRIRTVFEQVTRHSLVLFNESLATTNMGESIYLARDIVCVLRQLGLRAVFTTHLHDLAAAVDEINAKTTGDSKVVSLVASPGAEEGNDNGRYSYRVQMGPPLGRSYANHIAARYGINFDQLQTLLAQRNLLAD
jgi:DNA mismatch repair protein MutS